MATKTLNGGLISYGPTLPVNTTAVDGMLFFKTDDVGVPSGLYVYGFVKDFNPGSFGNQVAQTWSRTLGTIDLAPLGGVLDIANGGTGNTVVVPGGVVYGAASSMAYTSVGSASQVLLSGGTGQPTWANQNTLNVNSANSANTANSATTAGSANTAQVAAQLGQSGNTAVPMTFNWAGLGGQPTWLWGGNDGVTMNVYNPSNFSVSYATSAGSATTATSATSASFAGTATTLATPRSIALGGAASGSASFDGSANIVISATVNNVQGYTPASAATPNTLALHDASGYLYAAYLNQSSSNSEGGVISQLMFTNGSDNFLRKASIAQVASSLTGAFVQKNGDTMTGALTTTALAVGSISLPSTGSMNVQANITALGFVSASGNVVSNSGQVIATNASVQAGAQGTTGYIRMQAPGSGNSGYVEFYGSNQVRAGYIGNTGSTGSTDGGGINYIAAFHAFSGNITATGNVTAYSSDGRLKKNVTVIENAVQKVLSLGGYSYDWDAVRCAEAGFKPDNEHEHGLIAQEVQKVMPDAVAPAPFNDKYLTVRYERIVALLTAAMGEQQRELDELRARLNALEAK